MTRTGKSERLSHHLAEPFAEINPLDAMRLRIRDADLVRVASPHGFVLARALLSPRTAPGSVFVPMHWNDQFASHARVGALVPAVTDPQSGQPAFKNVPIRIERFFAGAYGFAVSRGNPAPLDAEYWAVAKCPGGWRSELAFADLARDWPAAAAGIFAAPGTEPLTYHDPASGHLRFAAFEGDRLVGALIIAPEPVAVSRTWLVEQLSASHKTVRDRLAVIATRPGHGIADRGPIVCSCFGVGSNEIAAAVTGGCLTLDTVGHATRAGTNCGSCRGDIRAIIESRTLEAAE